MPEHTCMIRLQCNLTKLHSLALEMEDVLFSCAHPTIIGLNVARSSKVKLAIKICIDTALLYIPI